MYKESEPELIRVSSPGNGMDEFEAEVFKQPDKLGIPPDTLKCLSAIAVPGSVLWLPRSNYSDTAAVEVLTEIDGSDEFKAILPILESPMIDQGVDLNLLIDCVKSADDIVWIMPEAEPSDIDETEINTEIIQTRNFTFIIDKWQVFYGPENVEIHLTYKESVILMYMMKNYGKKCTFGNLLGVLHDHGSTAKDKNAVKIHIYNIRRKINKIDPNLDPIKSMRSTSAGSFGLSGYVLSD